MNNRPVAMALPSLADIPAYALPDGFALRGYQPGDARHWMRIQQASDRLTVFPSGFFRRKFGVDNAALAARQLYLLGPRAQPIGTATAWWEDTPEGAVGLVHWVAILPTYQGQGLARPLLSVVCTRLAALGHRSARLRTSTARVPAINLYLRFGFQPIIDSPAARDAWRSILPDLKYPLGSF